MDGTFSLVDGLVTASELHEFISSWSHDFGRAFGLRVFGPRQLAELHQIAACQQAHQIEIDVSDLAQTAALAYQP